MTSPVAPGSLPLANAKRERFVQEYLKDLNATQAVIRSGYSKRGARVTGSRLLADANIASRIANFQAEYSEKTGITTARVLEELAVVGFASVENVEANEYGALEVAVGAPAGAVRAVASVKRTYRRTKDEGETVTVEVRYWPKVQALELLGRHLGLFPNKVELTGKDGGPIEVNTAEVRDRLADRIARLAASN
jgi:phage terminase small subunit